MNRLQKLAGIKLNEVSEADMKKLRRVVILAVFNSEIPSQIKRDLGSAIASAPDSDVRKITKVFLDQVMKDEETLATSPEYQELKQDPEFQKLSQNITNMLNRDNKAGLLDMSNIGFTTSDIAKPFSYSILLYHAVEPEAAKLLSYLTNKYGKELNSTLYSMLPRQSKPAIRPTKENLDELGQEELIGMLQPNHKPSEEFDKKFGTHLAKTYNFPLDANIVRNEINKAVKDRNLFNDDSYSNNINTIYDGLIKANSNIKIKVKDTEDKWNVIYGIISHYNPDDIKYFVESSFDDHSQDETEKNMPVEKAYDKYSVAINWIPSPKSWEVIKNTLTTKFPDITWPLENLMEEARNFFK